MEERLVFLSWPCWQGWSLVAVPEFESGIKGIGGITISKGFLCGWTSPDCWGSEEVGHAPAHIGFWPPSSRCFLQSRETGNQKAPVVFLKKPPSRDGFMEHLLLVLLSCIRRTPVQATDEDHMGSAPFASPSVSGQTRAGQCSLKH